MADHFEEVINLRIAELETRVDDEVQSVKEHFEDQQKFIIESLNNQTTQLRTEFRADLNDETAERRADAGSLRTEFASLRAEVRDLRADVRRLEQRVGANHDATRREFGRLEQKMDARFDAVHLVLREILGRLPPPPAA